MKREKSYIPGTLYDYFDVDGKPKSKETFKTEAVDKSSYKIPQKRLEKKEFKATKLQIKKYNIWLEDFQEDIERIIAKYRYNTHLLSAEELASEINLSLLKKRNNLILYIKNNKIFNQKSFKHCAFIYARNLIKWSQGTLINKSYIKRRVDGTVYDEENGLKSTYEAIMEKEGVEDAGYNFDEKEKQKKILKIIKDYSSILTNEQRKVFAYLESGFSHDEIAIKLNITRQAVSASFIEIKNKVRAHFNGFSLKDESYDKVTKGNNAIEDFFNTPRCSIEKKDRDKIGKILILNPKKYTSKDLCEHFFGNKYNYKQIVSLCVKQGWYPLLKKIRNQIKIDSQKLAKMLKNKTPQKEISKMMGISINSLRARIGHLKRKNLIDF